MNLSPSAQRSARSADRSNAIHTPSRRISRILSAWALALALGLGAASSARASVTPPAGLNIGDTYRLVFVTSTTIDATSTDISVYNAHVTAAAAAMGFGPGIFWAALASTQSVNALANLQSAVALSATDTTTPFFNTAGQLIATGLTVASTGLYQGNTGNHLATILTEDGEVSTANDVWTGTHAAGNTAGTAFLGGASGNARTGRSAQLDFDWTSQGALSRTNLLPLYGVSGLLTVTSSPVPEPTTVALMGGALLAIGLAKIRRGRN
jgi:hypothetical protein